tara:strand:- start:6475 stop:6987 length:513 start_codon:yes stop_codon:yes gene_type:complete
MRIIKNDNGNKLNSEWNFYFHDPNSYNWDKKSYYKIYNLKSIIDYWNLNKEIENKIHQGMFFLMRDNIFPLWDNEDNKKGSNFSFKILKDISKIFWNKLNILILSESFLKEEYAEKYSNINGISISPKKNFCIIKVWLKNKDIFNNDNVKEYFNIPVDYTGDLIFKNHDI